MDTEQKTATLLGGYRVLDLADEKGLYCGKLLADLGADVIKVEKPGGDPCRNIGPFYHDVPDKEKSLYWFHFNTSKRGITLDMEKRDGQELFRKLAATADCVVETSPPGHMDELGLGYASLEKINPRVIVVSITPFGQTGPYSTYKASDIVAMAMGGFMYLCGDTDRPPVRVTAAQAFMAAGLQGALGAMTALWHRATTGEGQHVDVSVQECVGNILDNPQAWDLQKILYRRMGSERTAGINVRRLPYVCKDGYIACWTPEPDLETALAYARQDGHDLEQDPAAKELIDKWRPIDKEFQETGNMALIIANSDLLRSLYDIGRPIIAQYTKKELLEKARERHIGNGPINTAKDLLESDQLAAREYFVAVEHPELDDTLTYPGAPVKLSETPWRIQRRPPLVGEHNEEVYEKELGISREEIILLAQAGVI
jgi:benzylsuccinate CoA-transferase BbsE subunit